jgi:hypothetical protein
MIISSKISYPDTPKHKTDLKKLGESHPSEKNGSQFNQKNLPLNFFFETFLDQSSKL